MEFISLIGLLALLAIGWLMSYHRDRIPWRTVAWGLGLQFLFAVIILRQDWWSFFGMAVFAFLVGSFILLKGDGPLRERRGAATGVLVAAALGAALIGWSAPGTMSWIILLAGIGAFFGGVLRIREGIRSYLAVVLLAVGVVWLVDGGHTGQVIFAVFSEKVASFLALSDYGARFLFGNLADSKYFFTGPGAAWPGFGFQFAFKVLPTIIFFGGFMGVLYYLGIMQKIIEAMARFMRWTVGTSGAETLSCSANIFVGQTEAPLLIKPFLEEMTPSELLTIMVGGFATIAGGVLAGYIGMGIPAGHLIAASVMSAPAALVLGKIIYPETEHSVTAGDVGLPEIETASNVIEAATNGISDGFQLALNVGAMLVGFIALIAVIDVGLNFTDSLVDGRMLPLLDTWMHGSLSRYIPALGTQVQYGSGGMSPVTGEFVGLFPGSLQTLFGTVLKPLAFLMGVPWSEASQVGNLLGIKLSLNEFVAYGTLAHYIQQGALGARSIAIATYALCGFANFSSIGIQIGGISAVAPGRRRDLARLGLRAMLGGALASWTTATIAGILM